MRLLLDTNAFLWWATEDPHLGVETSTLIQQADLVRVSIVSFWEIAIKISVGKLRADVLRMLAGAEEAGATLLVVTPNHCARVASLPLHHRDPFDRMLIAQAMEEGAALVTSDRQLAAYGVPIVRCG